MKKIFIIVVCLVLSVLITALPIAAFDLIEEDFDSAYPGDDPLTLDALYGYFEWLNATPDSACDVIKGEDGNVMKLSGYSDLRTMDYIPAEYVFSLAVKIPTPTNMTNIFVRGEAPGALQKTNPKNHDIMQVFNYYEWDWYTENGGKGGSGVGGSGLSVSFREGGIALCVKKYAEDSLTVASETCTVKYPESAAVGEYIRIKITDDAKRINVYINDELTAYVELSEEKVRYESDGTNVAYYKNAKVYDADGKLLLDVTDTRLHYNGSQLAIATRNETAYVDDLKIYFGEGAIEAAEKGLVPETKAQETQTEPAPETEDEETQTDAEETEETKAEEKGGMSKKVKIILIAAAVDVVIIAVLAFVIPKKKR